MTESFAELFEQSQTALNKLKPGYYALEVEVEDGQGRRDRRAQAFQVVDDKKAAETASNDEAALK